MQASSTIHFQTGFLALILHPSAPAVSHSRQFFAFTRNLLETVFNHPHDFIDWVCVQPLSEICHKFWSEIIFAGVSFVKVWDYNMKAFVCQEICILFDTTRIVTEDVANEY